MGKREHWISKKWSLLMWRDYMLKAETLISENSELTDFDGSVPEADIIRAQALLNITFPEAYRHFLNVYGVGNFGSAEVYGIIAGNVPAQSVPCVVFATLEERTHSDFPEDFVVIGSTGYGPLYCLAVSEKTDGDCPVREWNYKPVSRDKSSLMSRTFSEHFFKTVQNEI